MFDAKFIEMITHFHKYDIKNKKISNPWANNLPLDKNALDNVRLEQKYVIFYYELHREFYNYYSKFYHNYYKKDD